mmetsp:Transcript_126510/g.205596  ORF Transcript_126510/g.205596 Transcript_126510/m.205596 type:complete len:454 (-) Transcript_126510:47-1408(-)
MEVVVGTPPQKLDLIPDTGSDYVVIPDCRCVRAGKCDPYKKCFQSQGSSTFAATDFAEKLAEAEKMKAAGENLTLAYEVTKGLDGTLYAVLTYGSGPLTCSLGTDRITFGKTSATLEDSLFLVQSSEKLKVNQFGGLIGFGVPVDTGNKTLITTREPLFMQKAGVKRYSMCYNAAGEHGYLKWNLPKLTAPLGNVGTFHWGLDLQGVSVGNGASTDSSVLFCGASEMKPGMETACGALPDSGTTHILGPKEQINTLFAAICDNWPRCSKAAEKEGPGFPKMEMFLKLLMECGDWLGPDERALDDEVPPVTFHMGGKNGEKQKVQLSSWSYIGETTIPKFKEIHKKFFGNDYIYPVPAGTTKTCSPSFEPHDYNTVKNGPIWILGTPLFFDKTVSYDISLKPPAVSIDDTPCSPCDASLLSTSGGGRRGRRKHQKIRSLNGPTREPDIDETLPL